LWVGVAVIVSVVLTVVGVALAIVHHHAASPGPASRTLLRRDALLSPPNLNYSGVSFISNTSGVRNATYFAIRPVQLYLVTPAEFRYKVTKNVVSGYVWTSQSGGHGEFHYPSLELRPGAWVFATANTDPTNSAAVGFNIPLTLTAT
jgi:hypothetical protein